MANQLMNYDLLKSLRNLAGDNEDLRLGFESGLDLSGLGGPNVSPSGGFFGFGSLGRLPTGINQDQADLLQFARPVDPGRAQETTQALGSLGALGGMAGPSATTTQAVQGLANKAQQPVQTQPEMFEALNVARTRLGGLKDPEITAMREQGQQQINRQLQSNLRSLNVGNAMRGLQGNAAAAPALDFSRGALDARRNLERDLLLANVAERRAALQDFGGLANQTSANRRADLGLEGQGLQALFGASSTLDQDVFNREGAARGGFLNALNQQQGFEEARRQARLGQFQGVLGDLRNEQLARDVFNLGQLEKEKAGQMGLLFGTAGLTTQQQAARDALDIANRQLDIAESQSAPAFPALNFGINLGGGQSLGDEFWG